MGAVRLTVAWEACIDPDDATSSTQNVDIFVNDNVFAKIVNNPSEVIRHLPLLKEDIEKGIISKSADVVEIRKESCLIASFSPSPIVPKTKLPL